MPCCLILDLWLLTIVPSPPFFVMKQRKGCLCSSEVLDLGGGMAETDQAFARLRWWTSEGEWLQRGSSPRASEALDLRRGNGCKGGQVLARLGCWTSEGGMAGTGQVLAHPKCWTSETSQVLARLRCWTSEGGMAVERFTANTVGRILLISY